MPRPPQATHLEQLEHVIHQGLATFVEVGNALMNIRDLRLYRANFKTFEDYCNTRWGLSRRRSDELISAAGVVGNLSGMPLIPANERQANPLTRLEPEQQCEAWQRAVETAPDGKITAAHVERVAQEVAPRRRAVESAPVPACDRCGEDIRLYLTLAQGPRVAVRSRPRWGRR